MYKNLLVLPDGTEIFSGSSTKNAIKNIKATQMVNGGEELTIGSACSNMIEAALFTPGGDMNITAGDELTHYKVDAAGNRTKVGLFTVEQPTRPTPNTMKIVGYDRMAKLDKDMSSWLDSLDAWPYSVNYFASMACRACGVTFVEQDGLPNADFPIRQWKKNGATGRQIMRWLGEIVCRFVYADPDGNIRFGWYRDYGKSYTPAGENYFFAGSLSYENYQVAPVEAVQIRLADNDSGALWPMLPDGTNSYIITGNPILTAYVTEDLLPYLDVIAGELAQVTYTPCEVAVRAALDVNAGDIIHITDKNGKTFSTYVMSKITSGQRDTLSSTGSRRRDSTSAANNKSESEKMAETEAVANSAQNTANEKKRVFVSQPVPPYDVGDLWAQGSTGDLMRCKTARDSGAFVYSDWELATKYVDEDKAGTIAQNKVNEQTQLDVFNKLTNNGQDQGIYLFDNKLYINATYIKSGKIISEGVAYLPPTYDDCIDMLRSLSFPDRYPPKDFYDINADGEFDVEDVRLANRVYLGESQMSECAGAIATPVTVIIDPFNAEETIKLEGVNMWGKQIKMSLGVVRSRIPHIDGDCTVSGRFSVGGHLVTPSLAIDIGETPKTLSWKDNGDGTFTLIGQ